MISVGKKPSSLTVPHVGVNGHVYKPILAQGKDGNLIPVVKPILAGICIYSWDLLCVDVYLETVVHSMRGPVYWRECASYTTPRTSQ